MTEKSAHKIESNKIFALLEKNGKTRKFMRYDY